MDDCKMTIPAGPLARALKAVTVAVSKDRTRPHLCCVQVQVTGGVLTLAATDSYRLHVATVSVDGGDVETPPMLWPASFAADAAKACTTRDGLDLATVTVEGRTVTVSCNGTTVGAVLATDSFPSWTALMDGCDERRVDADIVGMSSTYLADIGKAAKFVDKDAPVKLVAADALKPSLWTVSAAGVELRMLLMPVRV